MPWQLEGRIQRGLELALANPRLREPRARLAAHHLFSMLAHLEQVAVAAAERGDGVQGQLEDEIVHREIFTRAAASLVPGGLSGVRAPASAAATLVEFLLSLRGDASLAILNVAAETWLETVLRHLEEWDVAPGLFRLIADDEARHVALADVSDDIEHGLGGVCAPGLLRQLETFLVELVQSPEWLLPLVELGSAGAVAEMGLAVLERHAGACARLGTVPGPGARDLWALCRAGLRADLGAPVPIKMRDWERTKQALWADRPCWMWSWTDFWAPAHGIPPALVEAAVVRSLARIAEREPRVNRTCAQGAIWSPGEPLVGVRRLRADGQVITVHVPHAYRYQVAPLARVIHRRAESAAKRPYRPLPPLGTLRDLLPPGRAFATVSQNAPYGCETGFVSPTQEEGGWLSVVIGGEEMAPRWNAEKGQYAPWPRIRLGLVGDHRAVDGAEAILVTRELRTELEKITWPALSPSSPLS